MSRGGVQAEEFVVKRHNIENGVLQEKIRHRSVPDSIFPYNLPRISLERVHKTFSGVRAVAARDDD